VGEGDPGGCLVLVVLEVVADRGGESSVVVGDDGMVRC
jgi:hypothetical protein